MTKPDDLKVFIAASAPTCGDCKDELGPGAWITLAGEKGALCLSCSDLEHLVFLPSGNTALTRRSKKYSTLSAVVLKWSRQRKRYERQGLLVQEPALLKAEEECAADEDERKVRRARASERRAELDQEFVKAFAGAIIDQFPGCPTKTSTVIAKHACRKYSGRVGRSAAAKALDEGAVKLAVIAHVRHAGTDYDRLLMNGVDRRSARAKVQPQIEHLIARWRLAEHRSP